MNSWIVKNNYLLPLISDLIDIIRKKMFTKMNLRWGYNNVRIKEEDKWKAVFSMPEGAFEPTVMFFRLTNSLAMFQAMMNDLLRDMIETEKIAVFIDDVMIATEIKEEHDKIVEYVRNRLATKPVMLKVCNVKLSFNIWLVLYMYFILYS